jgi:hypothetical protein
MTCTPYYDIIRYTHVTEHGQRQLDVIDCNKNAVKHGDALYIDVAFCIHGAVSKRKVCTHL